MEQQELQSVVQSFLDAFNNDDWERLATQLDPQARLEEINLDRPTTTGAAVAARLREMKVDTPGLVGAAIDWVVDTSRNVVAVELDLGIPDAAEGTHAVSNVFLRVSEAGLISDIREQHVRRGIDARLGCVLCILPPPNPERPNEGSAGPAPQPDA
jgi:hypothetical protein